MLSFKYLKVIFDCFIFVLHLNCKVHLNSSSGAVLLFYIAPSTVGSWSLALTLGNLKKNLKITVFEMKNSRNYSLLVIL